tara:strand:- start:1090 stop:1911 length:822 start_codon:yes stop_codon:yes gene_type:complete
MKDKKCYLCNSNHLEMKYIINEKPEMETDFGIKKKDYFREVYKCKDCEVYNNFHKYDLDKLYSESYNEATYNNNILEQYNKIISFSINKSDNKHRVKRIVDYLKNHNKNFDEIDVLDIGSGLCVFLGELKKYGFKTHCIDPSNISTQHAIENVGVNSAFHGHLNEYKENKKFDVITLNKVLEHVQNPIEMLSKAKNLLNDNGLIYIELPEGKISSDKEGFIDREEFYLEHFTIFTMNSVNYLISAAGMKNKEMKLIHEPSDKYTIFSFLEKNN